MFQVHAPGGLHVFGCLKYGAPHAGRKWGVQRHRQIPGGRDCRTDRAAAHGCECTPAGVIDLLCWRAVTKKHCRVLSERIWRKPGQYTTNPKFPFVLHLGDITIKLTIENSDVQFEFHRVGVS